MLKVGLTGGYASGKSLVAQRLQLLGCLVINADKLGHEVLAPTGAGYQPTLALFGTSIQDEDGSINRRKLAAIVFNDPEKLAQLNAIVHPLVRRLEDEALSSFQAQGERSIAVIEAAILIETGRYRDLDKLLVTSCRVELQISRAMARDHIGREQAEQRIARQLADGERVRLADYVIDTNGTTEETLDQVERLYPELRQLGEGTVV